MRASPVTDIKPLEPAEGVLVWPRLIENKHRVLVSWLEWVEPLHWRVGGAWLVLVREEGGLVIWNMVHSQIICIWLVWHFSSGNSQPFDFLLQCFIQSCVWGTKSLRLVSGSVIFDRAYYKSKIKSRMFDSRRNSFKLLTWVKIEHLFWVNFCSLKIPKCSGSSTAMKITLE